MRRAIHKYRHAVGDISLDLPDGSLILKVADQRGTGETLDVWAEVPIAFEHGKVTRRLRVVPTGVTFEHEALEGFGHFETVVTAGGNLVWHVYLDQDGERWCVAPMNEEPS